MPELSFFQRPVDVVARDLIGCILRRRLGGLWLGVRIVETEGYGLDDPASHAYLGRTPSREPMWMPPGTIYMYHSRAGASLNVSCGTGPEAVLIKAGVPVVDELSPQAALDAMHRLNPAPDGQSRRADRRLCAGQTLLCRSLGLTVAEWTGRQFDPDQFYIEARRITPRIVATLRLGIRPERDDGRRSRYVDRALAGSATSNPLRRGALPGRDYWEIDRKHG
ncbi:MAG: DNA-3-methyladenine glycosylase [Chloroflexota bacterium]|nr:DNA-3-methyladenine glycosylase [Chloroflexota bacterium]